MDPNASDSLVTRRPSAHELTARFHALAIDSASPFTTKPRAKSMCGLDFPILEPDALPSVPTIEEEYDPSQGFGPNKRARRESENKRSGLVSRVRRAYSTIFGKSGTVRTRKLRTTSQPESHHSFRPVSTTSPTMPFCANWTPSLPQQSFIDSSRVNATFSPFAGAAARQSAARQNGFERLTLRSEAGRLRSRSPAEADRESAVSLSIEQQDEPLEKIEPESNMSRVDPLSVLPVELAAHILSSLDHSTLAKMERVSRSWQELAIDNQLWRGVFLEKFETPVGWQPKSQQKAQLNWKELFKARTTLSQQWRDGKGKAHDLHGHTDSVYCVQHDDEKIITGSRDRTIRVWDMRTLACVKVIGLPDAMENDLKAKAVGTNGGEGSSTSSRLIKPFANLMPERYRSLYHVPSYYHMASILCLQYDDEICVTGSSDCSLIVWDIKTWEPIRRLQHHHGGVLDVTFDKRKIVSCSKDTTICVWDRATGELMHVLVGHRGPVNAVQMRGDLIVSASGEGCAKLWNLNLNSSSGPMGVREFWSVGRGLACVEFSADARYLFAGGNDQSIYKFDANTGAMISQMMGHDGLVRSLFLDGSNRRLVSGSYDLSLRVWDFETGRQLLEFPNWSGSWLLSAKSDYRRIVSTGQDGHITVLDFGDGVPNVELLRGTNPGRSLSS